MEHDAPDRDETLVFSVIGLLCLVGIIYMVFDHFA